MLKMVLTRQDEILQGQQQSVRQLRQQLPQSQLSPNQLPPPSPTNLTIESHPLQAEGPRKLSSDSTQGSPCLGSTNMTTEG